MYSFEGEFKRKPIQSLGGSRKNEDKDDLLQKTQDARKQREDVRQRHYSSIAIQSFYRASKVREKLKHEERQSFDQLMKQVIKSNKPLELALMNVLLSKFIFFFNNRQDGQRLTWLTQCLVKQQEIVVKSIISSTGRTLHQLKHILRICCSHLQCLCQGSGQIASPLRMLEVYTHTDTFVKHCSHNAAMSVVSDILTYLVTHGYYSCMRTLLESKVPSSIEKTVTPPTPIAATILDLIRAPLSFVSEASAHHLRHLVIRNICRDFFSQPYSEQIKEFLLPALAYGQQPFPFIELLHALLPTGVDESQTKLVVLQGPGSPVSECMPDLEATPWLLFAVLVLGEKHLEGLSEQAIHKYLYLLHKLVPTLELLKSKYRATDEDSDSEDEMDVAYTGQMSSLEDTEKTCMALINQPRHVKAIVKALSVNPASDLLIAVSTLCHSLIIHSKLAVNRYMLLYTLAYNQDFLRNLWLTCVGISTKTVMGTQAPLLQMLARGLDMSKHDVERIVPLLSVFSCLFNYSLQSLHDSDFQGQTESRRSMPFHVEELVPMILSLREACLGIIELAHPETRPEVKEEYKLAFRSVGVQQPELTRQQLHLQRMTWGHLFKVLSQLVKQLYERDSRMGFCPPGHWLASHANIQPDQKSHFFKQSDVFARRQFGALGVLNPNRSDLLEDGPPLSTKEVRKLTILQELPFVVSFQDRVKIFHRLVQQDRFDQQGDMRHLVGGPSINVMIRRNFLYEDAFDKLSVDNEPNIKLKMQVQLVNFAGANEAGIDGGGLFREFMWELLKTAFDPNRGFFKYNNDKLLYPNPHAKMLVENYTSHYFFLGRMLGKAIFENMLVELPFASFFLSKLLSRSRGDVDIHHLASLDPEMYKNLLFLKNYNGNVKDLDLDFTVTHNEFGEIQEEELKTGGKQIAVDNNNRIEYIHLMADYMLNKRIRVQCDAFRKGVADVVNIEWLRMFNCNELQVLISGSAVPIDLEDLKQHTNYSGGFTSDHACIKLFWSVLEDFTDDQKRRLLKFVTSCSRPPLLGFKDLFPALCIHYAGSDDERLPTASTCMNLLKLPEFHDKATMSQKLLYAIESGSGFELS